METLCVPPPAQNRTCQNRTRRPVICTGAKNGLPAEKNLAFSAPVLYHGVRLYNLYWRSCKNSMEQKRLLVRSAWREYQKIRGIYPGGGTGEFVQGGRRAGLHPVWDQSHDAVTGGGSGIPAAGADLLRHFAQRGGGDAAARHSAAAADQRRTCPDHCPDQRGGFRPGPGDRLFQRGGLLAAGGDLPFPAGFPPRGGNAPGGGWRYDRRGDGGP